MVIQWLLVLHIAVLGYWLGSELVINNMFRLVAYGSDLPFAARERLMDRVMSVDQHVRYALILQLGLGFAIATLYGYVPGGPSVAILSVSIAALWLGFVELVHRSRGLAVGIQLARIDRVSRYIVMFLLVTIALKALGADWAMPGWLRLKLLFFAGVMGCGVGIRFALLRFFGTWALMAVQGPDEPSNARVRQIYWQATAILFVLWGLIAVIVALSVLKPTILG